MKILIPLFLLAISCAGYTKNKNNYVTTYYPNGVKESEGPVDSMIKSLKSGIWKFYYPDGKLKNISHYSKGKINGTSIQYFENGKLSDSLNYRNGYFFGDVKYYYPNGQLNFEDHYDEDGKNQGVFELWYSSGTLSQMGNYKDGKMIGKWIKYYENKKVNYVSYYNS